MITGSAVNLGIMDDHEIPHGLTREEWMRLTPEERLAMLLVDEPRPVVVQERALEAFEEWRRRGPA